MPKISWTKLDPKLRADVLFVPVSVPKGKPSAPKVAGLRGAAVARLKELAKNYHGQKRTGAIDATTLPAGGKIGRIALLSLGEKKAPSAQELRLAAASAVKWCEANRCGSAAIALDALLAAGGADAAGPFAEGAGLAGYRFDTMRKKPAGQVRLASLRLASARPEKAVAAALKRAGALSDAANLVRQLGHTPPNVINPVTLAEKAKELAKEFGLKYSVLDEKQMKKMGMGAILAVGAGSATPPRIIALEHAGKNPKAAPVVLVGKAITLDSGGISIKPADSIPDMKYDKQGGMTVIGALTACAALNVPQRVVGVIGSAENVIDSNAYRPGDILTAMNGKTIEVANTDAEGRLVLADALHWAESTYKPAAMIDLATLTGACVVALGKHAAGLFTRDDKLSAQLLAAARRAHEGLWRMPMWAAYHKQIESTEADIKNTGGRGGGSITAALFLQEFVTTATPWAHLDIAGVANDTSASPLCPVGATGWGVRTLVDWVENREKPDNGTDAEGDVDTDASQE